MIALLESAVTVVTFLYLALVAGLYVLSLVVSEEARGLLRTFLAVLLFVSLALLPVNLLFQHWTLALFTALPFAGLLLIYGPFLRPRRAPTTAAPVGELSILTFNLQGATDALDSLAAIIESAKPDIIGVQELSNAAADYFRSALRDTYGHMALYPQEDAIEGGGVFSRYPIVEEAFWKTEQIDRPLGNVRVQLDLGRSAVAFYSVHPTPPFSLEWGLTLTAHRKAVAEIYDRIQKEDIPVILCGDFNMTDHFPEYRRITTALRFRDAFRDAGDPGLGFTFPAGQRLPLPPLIRLDYIFHDEIFQTTEARVWRRSGASDHLPVYARLALMPLAAPQGTL